MTLFEAGLEGFEEEAGLAARGIEEVLADEEEGVDFLTFESSFSNFYKRE